MTTTSNVPERFSRQADIIPMDQLSQLKVMVVGTGAIGRQVALQLAAMGVSHLTLVDFDIVEEGNLAAQGFLEGDLGQPKVAAVANLCRLINSKLSLVVVNGRYTNDIDTHDIVFSCVDKMDARSFIHTNVRTDCKLFIDGRMAAEAMRVISAYNEETHDYYRTTLFSDLEATPIRCTAKTTIYSSNIIAGIMIGQLTKWMREVDLHCDIQYNLLTDKYQFFTPETAHEQFAGGFRD